MIEHILIALALAMDCFTVSIVCGAVLRKWKSGVMLRIAFLFGLFQAAMPLLGWLLTSSFKAYIEAYDHWIAFGMLAIIGGKMIADSFKEEDMSVAPEKFSTEILLAIATSIDALAVGVSYACTGYDSVGQLSVPLGIIGAASFILSLIGTCIGVKAGKKASGKFSPELLGGVILIGIGVKILLDHLGLI